MHHVAFLRGLNVGGHRVTNDALAAVFVDLGLGQVAPFLASGNVVFDADGRLPDELTPAIEQALADALGYDVPTFLRTAADVRSIASAQPFHPAEVEASAGKLQVSFLRVAPSSTTRAEVLARTTDDDRLAFGDRELFWLPSGGTQESTLDLAAIERSIGPVTMRTKNTIERLSAKFLSE